MPDLGTVGDLEELDISKGGLPQHTFSVATMSLQALSVEVIQHCLSFNSTKDIYSMSLTSREMFRIAQKPLFFSFNSSPRLWPRYEEHDNYDHNLWIRFLFAIQTDKIFAEALTGCLHNIEIRACCGGGMDFLVDDGDRYEEISVIQICIIEQYSSWIDVSDILSMSFHSRPFGNVTELCLHVPKEQEFPTMLDGRGRMLPALTELTYTGR